MTLNSVLVLASATAVLASATALLVPVSASTQLPDLVALKPQGHARIQGSVPGAGSLDVTTPITAGRVEFQRVETITTRRFSLTRMSLHFADVMLAMGDQPPIPLQHVGLHLRDAFTWLSHENGNGIYNIFYSISNPGPYWFDGDPTFVVGAKVSERFLQEHPEFDTTSFIAERRATEDITGTIDLKHLRFNLTAVVDGPLHVDWWPDGDFRITLTLAGCFPRCE